MRVIASRIEQISEEATHFLLVHETDGKVDGTVFVSFCPDPMFGTLPFTIVDNLIVANSQDLVALRALLTAIEKLSREHSSTKVVLMNSDQNDETLAMYQELGYNGNDSRTFTKSLGSEKEIHS